MKIDPYNHEERYLKWKELVKNGIPGMNEYNSNLVLRYLQDMEHGINTSRGTVKGSRSYIRLNTLRDKMNFFTLKFKERYNLDKITDISEQQLGIFFSEMKKGIIKKRDGGNYSTTAYSVKCFKAFWHWYMKINKREGKEILDITTDLDTREDKPKWVYLDEEQVKKFCENVNYEYRVLITFLFDTGIRAPTELMNIKVSDLYNDYKELIIRDEISKTFGRRIKLMLSSDLIKEFIKINEFSREDYIFQKSPQSVNKYIKRMAKKIFGEKESLAGEKYSEMTMYDFRHISCCYWLPRYKSESALKFRFGWKKSDKIHYYSEMLGMRDTIREEDLLVDVTKTEIEKRLMQAENKNERLSEELDEMRKQMMEILEHTKILGQNLKKEVVLISNDL